MAAKKRYTREQRRAMKERKQLKTNDKIARVTFIASLVFFLMAVAFLVVPFIAGVVEGLTQNTVNPDIIGGENVAALATTLEENTTNAEALGWLLVILLALGLVMIWLVMGSFVCPFILALGLRRGEEKDERLKRVGSCST